MNIRRKIIITLSFIIAIMLVIGFSYAKFIKLEVTGNNSTNIIIGNTISASELTPNIIVSYDEGNNYIDTGVLNLSSNPYIQLIKFKAYTSYSQTVNIEVSLISAVNTTSGSTYSLYECSLANYQNVTSANVASSCTNIGKTSGNTLPDAGEFIRLHNDVSITIPGAGSKYFAIAINIPATNNGKKYKGIINTVLKDMSIFDFTYTGSFNDKRIDGLGDIEFLSSGTLTVLIGGTPQLYLLGGGGGGGGGAGNMTGYSATSGGGGGSGYWNTIAAIDVSVGTYNIVVGTGGTGGAGGSKGDSEAGTYGVKGNDGTSTTAFGYTVNSGKGGNPGTPYATTNTGGAGGNAGGDGAGSPGAGGSPNGGNGGAYGFNKRGSNGSDGTSGMVKLTFS